MRLDIGNGEKDDILGQVLDAASRQIDGWTARTFVAESGVRILTAEHDGEVQLGDDLLSVTSLATDDAGDRSYSTAWDAIDYELVEPAPYSVIYVAPFGRRMFPRGRNRVRVEGMWGYSLTPPAPIVEATLLLASRLYTRKDAPFGVTGSAEHGELQTLPGMDPDVKQLIQPYRRFGMVVM
ncbi:MAG TPA: hypothetical protein VNZ58_03620 [Thermomicrobiales bacterium]|nr:hypothetical protein [Thermomicrobiales bacterium]